MTNFKTKFFSNSRKNFAHLAIPVRHLPRPLQTHRGGDAPRRVRRGRRAADAGHLGHVWRAGIPRDARSLHLLGGRLHPGVLAGGAGRVVRGGARTARPHPVHQGRGGRAHRGGWQQTRHGGRERGGARNGRVDRHARLGARLRAVVGQGKQECRQVLPGATEPGKGQVQPQSGAATAAEAAVAAGRLRDVAQPQEQRQGPAAADHRRGKTGENQGSGCWRREAELVRDRVIGFCYRGGIWMQCGFAIPSREGIRKRI